MSARPDGGFTNRLVFLHGFTQTHHHWHTGALTLGGFLGTEPALAFVDLPGHGLSTYDAAPITEGATWAAALGGPGTYVGYSMGGRFALLAALARPDLVERLVLIGATAGIADEQPRTARCSLDDERAERVEEIGVDRFLDEWLAAPMFAGLPTDPSGLDHRRRNTAAGLARSLRSSGTGRQPSVWTRLSQIDVPTLVIAGERDAKFLDIGRRLTADLPQATFAEIPGAGHAVHIESPATTAELIAAWLSGQ